MRKLTILSAFALVSCGSGEAAFQSACIDAIKKRLKAPSTFDLIDVTANHQPVSVRSEARIRRDIEAVKDKDDTDSRIEELQLRRELVSVTSGDKHSATNLQLIIEYDAQNAMGVPLRGLANCTAQGGPNGEFSSDDDWKVEIDGETHTDWIVNQVKRQQ